ncbi:hypothetical protein PBI_DUKE13_184 [Mycobacterium phage Duke13]|uniref:Uncharacterized protein n=1 Tax=Mycobacterium phage Duke13 TaxID=2499038 RepID=A0A3S9UB58_9CAUD|nr:hypothetical protein PBI_DUKE13_184 [Mycobacterium phage Duke13]
MTQPRFMPGQRVRRTTANTSLVGTVRATDGHSALVAWDNGTMGAQPASELQES